MGTKVKSVANSFQELFHSRHLCSTVALVLTDLSSSWYISPIFYWILQWNFSSSKSYDFSCCRFLKLALASHCCSHKLNFMANNKLWCWTVSDPQSLTNADGQGHWMHWRIYQHLLVAVCKNVRTPLRPTSHVS